MAQVHRFVGDLVGAGDQRGSGRSGADRDSGPWRGPDSYTHYPKLPQNGLRGWERCRKKLTNWCQTKAVMNRATVAIPEDLAKAVDSYVRDQEARPQLAEVVQAG